ncbi:MAG: ATP-dependent RNA helicase DbpA [Luminiphilus sp.]|nr:ATP-dependent RNA helicase DbpA [Luminiphilus sp.]
MTQQRFESLKLSTAQLQNLRTLGFETMTDIQAAALPVALAGGDLIGQAKTGSGKTLAFGLPLLNKINPRDFGAQGLILCPTRELATQVAQEIRRLARYQPNIKVVVLCGGQSIGAQIGSLEHGGHVIVGTPGRIRDHLRKQTLSLERISTLVLDEADRMLDMGFIDDMSHIIGHTPAARQTLFFSATYPDDIRKLSGQFQRSPARIKVEDASDSPLIEQRFFICHKESKPESVERLLRYFQPDNAVVFCNTKDAVRDVAARLRRSGIAALALHGDLEQRDRDRVLIQFRQQSCRVLVATDVAARGLDIADLAAVVNSDIPHDPETYLHRIGRTGRAGKQGLAVTLLAASERFRLERLADDQKAPLSCEPLDTLTAGQAPLPAPRYVTLRIAGGRKDKVRPGDILGALTREEGVTGGAVGKIDVTDYAAYVAIERGCSGRALQCLSDGKIKGRKFKVQLLKN